MLSNVLIGKTVFQLFRELCYKNKTALRTYALKDFCQTHIRPGIPIPSNIANSDLILYTIQIVYKKAASY